MRIKFFRQRPIPGGRTALPASVFKEIWDEVDHRARKYKVSRSWVVAFHLAQAFGIKEQPDYHTAHLGKKVA